MKYSKNSRRNKRRQKLRDRRRSINSNRGLQKTAQKKQGIVISEKSKKIGFVTLAAVLLLIIIGIGIFLFFGGSNKVKANVLIEAGSNISEYTAELTVVVDTTPPVISGALDKEVMLGGTIAYRAGITVTDDYDANVQFTVDSSRVNLNKSGVYDVIYSATDESGNRAEVKGTVTVVEIDMTLVNKMADGILSEIINNSMTKYEKARAIYNWVACKMKYSANVSPREIVQAAHNCFSKGTGDCYTYMAASQVLLTRAGIDNRTVRRYAGAERPHYWNIVNVGDGWHHFDACPTPDNAVNVNQRFMFTESQAIKYTQALQTSYRYYEYDKSTVPEVVE